MYGANFRMVTPHAKIRNFETANFKFTRLTFDLHTDSTEQVSLYRFFAKSSGRSDLPDPSGALSASVNSSVLVEAEVIIVMEVTSPIIFFECDHIASR